MPKPAGAPKRWESESGALTVAAVRRLYDSQKYRVSSGKYEPGAEVNGYTSVGTWYVISGRCRATFDRPIELRAGDVFASGEGAYQIEVLGDEPLELVEVWDLEALFAERGLKWSPPENLPGAESG
jgi:mannose-6-phosphate isomerase-like protein (cupin superfamily)